MALSDYNKLSSIPSTLNSILDKLINEEGDRGAAPTSMASAEAGINDCACALPTCEECTHRERRALKQRLSPVRVQVRVRVQQSLRFFLTVTWRLGEEKLRIHADGLQH